MRRYYGSRCQRTHIKSTKNPGSHTYFEILGISLEIPSISNSRFEKPNILKFLIQNTQDFDQNPRFLIEIPGILIEILGFSFQILGISKLCHNCILQTINIFNSNIRNIVNINTSHCQIMATIAQIILKFNSMIKKQKQQIIHSLLFFLLVRSIPLLISILS